MTNTTSDSKRILLNKYLTCEERFHTIGTWENQSKQKSLHRKVSMPILPSLQIEKLVQHFAASSSSVGQESLGCIAMKRYVA